MSKYSIYYNKTNCYLYFVPIDKINSYFINAYTSTGSFSQAVSPTNFPGVFSIYLKIIIILLLKQNEKKLSFKLECLHFNVLNIKAWKVICRISWCYQISSFCWFVYYSKLYWSWSHFFVPIRDTDSTLCYRMIHKQSCTPPRPDRCTPSLLA